MSRTQVFGTRELLAAMDKLEVKVRKKALRRAVTAAVRPIKAAYKANIPERYGLLKKSVDTKVRNGRKSTYGIVGARADKEATIRDTFGNEEVVNPNRYAHLVEDGTKAHKVHFGKVLVPHPGSRGSHPMLRAWESTKGTVEQIMVAKLQESIIGGS